MPAWLTLAALRKLPWRLIAKIGAVAVVVGVIWWQIHSYGERRYEAGKEHVQAKWGVEAAQLRAAADAAIRENERKDAADAARNKEIADAYEKKLSAATADTRRLERLLRDALQAAASGSAPGQGPDLPRVAPTSSPGSPEPPDATAGILADIAAALTESRQNADQLDSLRMQIIPQLSPQQ